MATGRMTPADITHMLARAEAEGGQIMIAGHRVHRKDSWVKRRSCSSRTGSAPGCCAGRDAIPTGCCYSFNIIL